MNKRKRPQAWVEGIDMGRVDRYQIRSKQEGVHFIESVVARVKPYGWMSTTATTGSKTTVLPNVSFPRPGTISVFCFYEDYTSYNFQPDIFVDIEEVLNDKLHIIKALIRKSAAISLPDKNCWMGSRPLPISVISAEGHVCGRV